MTRGSRIKNGEKTEERDDRGRFRSGNRPGPGRPPGSRNKASVIAQDLLDGEAEKIARKCVDMALGGDVTAIRLCLERLVPPRKEVAHPFDLPSFDLEKDPTGALDELIAAVREGHCSTGEAQALASLIRVRQEQSWEQRIQRLEELLEAKR